MKMNKEHRIMNKKFLRKAQRKRKRKKKNEILLLFLLII